MAAALAKNAVVAIGVSGGKDSSVLALTVNQHLDEIGHPREKRVLIHSHLGGIEWQQSLPWCEKLASFLGLELIVVSRKAGGMIERWETRWANNWARYVNLECLKLILPWSTPAMRFCTSELKTAVICAELKRRFPGEMILSARGIRSQESANRAKAPVCKVQPKLQQSRLGTEGLDWSPIKDFTLEDVWAVHEEFGFPPHPAYFEFGCSRVSCAFCILSTAHDQLGALKDPANHESYARLCRLELKSGFCFQGDRWLCDLHPEIREMLLPGSGEMLNQAKAMAAKRMLLEAMLPKDLLFVKGCKWPPRMVTRGDAELIAEVRNQMFELYQVTDRNDPEWIQEELNSRVLGQQLVLL